MPPHRIDHQYLLDRAAIHDLHVRYFQGLDRGEPDQVRRCFTEDVIASYDGRSALRPGGQAPVRGIDALMGSLVTFKKQRTGEWKVTTHFMGNLNINVREGDVAEMETNAIACLVLAGEPTDQVAMRSLRYLDRLRRTEDGWRISERLYTLDWSCQAPTTLFPEVTGGGRSNDTTATRSSPALSPNPSVSMALSDWRVACWL